VSTPTIRQFLRYTDAPDNPFGDFVRDARQDRDMPMRFKGREALRAYLFNRSACDGAMTAGDEFWKR
jgi:hypothetical protein